MSVNSLSDLSRQHMLNILGYNSGSPSAQTGANSLPSFGSSSGGSTQLSSFAQMLTELQQLEQSNPTKYAQVTQQISNNLGTAASNAQTAGKSAVASRLSTLSQDFSTASQTGQLPNVSDLAQVLSGTNASSATVPGAVSGASAGTTPHHGILKSMQNFMHGLGF